MKEPLTDERGKGEKAFSWLYKLAGKNNRTKDDISPALRAHTEEMKREITDENEKGGLGVPQRSRSMSVQSAEKKDTRRKSLADVFSSRGLEQGAIKHAKAEEDKAKGAKKDHEKAIKATTDAERALAKAKKAEEQALIAKNEAQRLIAEANKAIAAASRAAQEAALKQEKDKTGDGIDVSVVEDSRVSSSDRATEPEISHNSVREDSERKGLEDPMSSASSSALNFGQIGEDTKSDSPRESTSRGGFFSSISKKIIPGHGSTHLGIDDDYNRNASLSASVSARIDRETKIRSEYALVAERAAKKAIKQAAKAKLEAESAATKAADAESRQAAKEAKRRGRSPKVGKKLDLELHAHSANNDPDSSNRKSTSVNDLERQASSSNLSAPTLTLNEVLASESGIAAFKQFAAEGFVLENISFVLDVRAFDLLDEVVVGRDVWLQRAKEIYDTYVQVGSDQEVNMTSKIRKDVVEKFESNAIEPGVFKGLAGEALRILRTNDWPRFLKSEHYRKLEAAVLLEQSNFSCGL